MSVCPASVLRSVPSDFHIFTVASWLPVAMSPVGSKHTAMACVPALIVRVQFPVWLSQILHVPSQEPVMLPVSFSQKRLLGNDSETARTSAIPVKPSQNKVKIVAPQIIVVPRFKSYR